MNWQRESARRTPIKAWVRAHGIPASVFQSTNAHKCAAELELVCLAGGLENRVHIRRDRTRGVRSGWAGWKLGPARVD